MIGRLQSAAASQRSWRSAASRCPQPETAAYSGSPGTYNSV